MPFLPAEEAKPPAPGDFAGSLLVTGTGGSLLGLEIPEAVYQGLERPDLGDIRVFDASGLPVPFVIRRPPGMILDPPRSVTALFDRVELRPAVREKFITGEWRGAGKRIVDYHTGGFYPLRAILFPLPQADFIEARLKNKFTPEGEWSFVTRTSLFRINSGAGGEPLQSEALEVDSSAPFWELEAAGEMAFSELPGCVIRWTVYELVFFGRGEGPWTVAWGNEAYGPPAEGLPGLPEPGGPDAGPGAGLPEIERARPLGEARYRHLSRPGRDWGSLFLWGILILAVIVLSALALSMAKAVRRGDSGG